MSRTKILDLVNRHPDVIRAVMEGNEQKSDDQKLLTLTVFAGQLAALIRDDGWSRSHLRRAFGFCTGWLRVLGEEDAVAKISTERDRQERLFLQGKHSFTCASRTACVTRKLRILVEEIGEVANAIDQLEIAESRESNALKEWRLNLRMEIVQVAAVCVAWLESFEVPA